MQLSAALLLGLCLQVTASGISQTVTFKGKDVPLETVFNKVEQQTGLVFVYTAVEIEKSVPVSIDVKQLPVEEFLQQLFKNQPLEFTVSEKTVFVKKKEIADLSPRIFTNTDPPITGVIRDAEGNPIAGVNIVIKGTKKGVTTDAAGQFSIDAGINEVLIISSIGYNSKELKIREGNTPLIVALEKSVSPLDEIQIIAYGNTAKRFVTGNIGSVSSEQISKQPVNNPLLALQGRVPGLFIEQSSGFSGTGVKVQIQGPNSMIFSNDPFYVIDGVPFTSQLLPNLGDVLQAPQGNQRSGNPFSFINPNMIESIEVLKDADATAIYGSRAANGAILITTKKGKTGKVKVDFNLQSGAGKVTRKMDFLSPSQYFEMRKEAYTNDGLPIPDSDIPFTEKNSTNYDLTTWNRDSTMNWQNEFIGNTSKFSDVQATISGGTDNIQYLIGTNYHKETTVISNNLGDQKKSLYFNLTGSAPNKKFSFMLSGSYLVDDNKLIIADLTQYINYAPNHPRLLNQDGSLNWGATDFTSFTFFPHPLADLQNVYKNNTTNFLTSGSLGYRLLPWITIRSNFGYTTLQTDELTASPSINYPEPYRASYYRIARYSDNQIKSWIIEPQLQIVKRLFGGTIDGLIGATIQKKEANGEILEGGGFTSDLVMEDVGAAATVKVNSSLSSIYRYNALFGRLNYNIRSRYIINVQSRRDGTSRYGAENRFHNFWSVGGAWIFSDENFLRNNSVISFGKLRASYGTTGSDQIPDYQYLRLYSNQIYSVPYNGGSGLLPTSHANPYLQWEETRKFSTGIDIGFWNDRLLFNGTYFLNRSSNQLLGSTLPLSTGFPSVLANLPATVQNSGLEFSISSTNIKAKHFTWQSALNFTLPKNKLIKFEANSSDANFYEVGKSINIVRVHRYAGVNETTGLYQFYDKEGNLTSSPGFRYEDRVTTVDPLPKFYGGFQNGFTYKQFSLDIFFQFTKQIGENTFFGLATAPGRRALNQPTSVLNRWQKSGDQKPIQKYSTTLEAETAYLSALASTAAWVDASYVRLKNLSLSYNLPSSVVSSLKLQNLRVYMQGQNLITITNYEGLDPETKSWRSLPPLRILTFGIQVTF